MTTTYAILINETNLNLITTLNGGVEPWSTAHGDYFVCELPVGPDTARDRIIGKEDIVTENMNVGATMCIIK